MLCYKISQGLKIENYIINLFVIIVIDKNVIYLCLGT